MKDYPARCAGGLISFAQFFLLSGLCFAQENTETIICGGFVTSEVPIDYSKIEIRLLDKFGNLKYQAACATNNGNYEVPVFGKKGEFVLAVSAPEGLAFEPNKITVNIDGITDPCSKQENINFRFKGYSAFGIVNSKTSKVGPSGVIVKVFDQAKKEVTSVTTGNDGKFQIPSLLPGTYSLEASHPAYVMDVSESSIVIKEATFRLPENSLVVRGYPTSGIVKSNGEPISDVKMVLYSQEAQQKDIGGCDKALLEELPKEYPQHGKQICSVKSDQAGSFVFGSLVPGKYFIVPTYKGGDTKYDIEPSVLEIIVSHEPLKITKVLEVKGFTAYGTVLTSAEGQGVPSAEIFRNGTLVAKTDKHGVYRLDKTVTGWYKIEVKKDFYDFPTAYLRITPAEPKIPTIFARSISVCGEIKTLRPVTRPLSFEAIDTKTGISRDVVIRDNRFCTLLESGEYKVSIFDAPPRDKSDKSQRFIFTPADKIIKLTDFPITDLLFSQTLGSIEGTIRCLGACPQDLRVSVLTGAGEAFANLENIKDSTGTFKFNNMDLGTHVVKVVEPSKRLCWDLVQKSVELTTVKPAINVGFTQTGFLLEVWSSHETEILYGIKGVTENRKKENIRTGFTELCLPEKGEYAIEPSSCHKFEHDVYSYNTDAPSRLNLHAAAHLTSVYVDTDDEKTSFKLRVKKTSDGSTSIFTPSGPPKVLSPGSFQYTFVEYFPAKENLVIVPFSETLLFKPVQAELAVTDQCDKNMVVLEAFKGVLITGGITPIVGDANVRLVTETDVLEGKTDPSGRYSLGPVPRSVLKNITAEKHGYEIELVPGTYDFKALKLSEIKVQTMDANKMPVQGVLVSISNSAGFRTSSFTDQQGVVSFVNVGHGDYIIRPMVKEFKFEPSSKSVTLTQGQTAQVEWMGTRVAYSAYGKVTSLVGDPEPGLTMEAVSREPCPQMQEESVTGTNGQFRISGLKADCVYEVRPKDGELTRMDIRWTSPANRIVPMAAEDSVSLSFLAFRGFNEAEFTGRVETTKELLTQLKVCLYRADRPDETIQCIAFAISPMFQFNPVPLDNRSYVIRLDTSLSKKEYIFTNDELPVKANSTFRHFVLPFDAKRRPLEPEISTGALFIVPLAVLAVLIYFNRDSVVPAVKNAVRTIRSSTSPANKDRKRMTNIHSALPSTGGEGSFDDYLSGGPTTLKKRPKTNK